MGGKGSVDTSGLNRAIYDLSSNAKDMLSFGKDVYGYGKGQYEGLTLPVLQKYKDIISGGTPYASYLSTGLGDVPTQQARGWEKSARQSALDVAGLGPVSKYMATEGVNFQGEQMLSQNIMGQIKGMLDALTGTGERMYGTAGGLSTGFTGQGMSGLSSAGGLELGKANMELQAQMMQGSVMGSIFRSIGSLGGLALGGMWPKPQVAGAGAGSMAVG